MTRRPRHWPLQDRLFEISALHRLEAARHHRRNIRALLRAGCISDTTGMSRNQIKALLFEVAPALDEPGQPPKA